jgi:hypothetical protein
MTSNRFAQTLSHGSARVLNCAAVTAELRELNDNAGPPLFHTTPLNHAVLIKDVREDERRGRDPTRIGTKVYLPFDPKTPLAGGQTIFFGDQRFRAAIANLVDLSQPRQREAFDRDTRVLEVIDSLPTLAPFLLRDRLERAGIEVDPRYFRLSEQEWSEIVGFIRAQFQAIVDALFADEARRARGAVDKLLEKLWDLSDIPALEDLAEAFRLPRQDCLKIFYAWKGVIFFTWEHAREGEQARALLEWLRSSDLSGVQDRAFRKELEKDLTDLHQRCVRLLADLDQRLQRYQSAFDDLFRAQKGPAAFLAFLSGADAHFQALGFGMAKLQHLVLVWRHATDRFPGRRLPQDSLIELLGTLNELAADRMR